MSDQGKPVDKPIVPAITGNPFIDTGIRVGLTMAATAITAAIVTHIESPGHVIDPNTALEISAAVLSTLIGFAGIAWSFIQTKLAQVSTAKHVIDAVATGQIPDSIMKIAVASPKVPEDQITKAVAMADTVKDKQ